MLSVMVPKDSTSMPVKFSKLKAMLDAVYDHNVTTVHICPNDCIAFWDATHPKLTAHVGESPEHSNGYLHAHRSSCPKCQADRYITIEGREVPAKVGYFFDPDGYMTGIFRDTDPKKEEFRRAFFGTHNTGHTSRSRGYHRKMSTEHMRQESRNQALIAMSDGNHMFGHIPVKMLPKCDTFPGKNVTIWSHSCKNVT